MEAAAIAKVLSGLLIVIRGLSGAFGITGRKLVELLDTAAAEKRDVGADDVQALIDDAATALDDLDAAIAAAEAEGEFRE